MNIFFPKDNVPDDARASLAPSVAATLVKLGAVVEVEAGLGASIHASDADYEKAGARLSAARASSLETADMVVRIRKPPVEEVRLMKRGAIHVSLLDPFREIELIRALASAGVSAISLEMIPRTTLAQKMDVLSSQANLAGYEAVILAAERLQRILPLMMTPAGTISPSRVFIIGVGVAGLQAIATAKRLGAVVEAFDTRPVVEEQVKSLGARFLKVDLGETGQTKDGYAKALTEEQLQKQRAAMAKACANADVVITTAQVFGRKAPVIVTTDMVKGMKPGSVAIDLAVESGGNVECSKPGEEIDVHGVRVIGLPHLQSRAAVHASQMFAANVANMIEHFWNKTTKAFELKRDDEIIKGCLITHGGEVVNETIRKAVSG
jgi:NAD(P) transhydrogenase subunit alpha